MSLFQYGVITGLKNTSRSYPLQIIGITPVILFSAGFAPQYWDIWSTFFYTLLVTYDILELKRVEGVSLSFLSLDIIGSVFSVISLGSFHWFRAIVN